VTEIVHVPFNGDDVLCADVNGRPHVVLKPALDRIGLDYSSQRAKLLGKSWATMVLVTTVGDDGRSREMVAVDLRTFLMLLATVDERRVAEAVRPALVAYQSRVADVIEAHFTKRRHPDDDEPRTLTWDETTAVLAQRYGIEMTVTALLRLLRTAGVLKQTSAPMAKYRHWFWFTGSTWNVHPHMVKTLAVKVADVRTELLGFRALQLQLELDGVGQNGIAA
jgi:hypothetical protein